MLNCEWHIGQYVTSASGCHLGSTISGGSRRSVRGRGGRGAEAAAAAAADPEPGVGGRESDETASGLADSEVRLGRRNVKLPGVAAAALAVRAVPSRGPLPLATGAGAGADTPTACLELLDPSARASLRLNVSPAPLRAICAVAPVP